MKCLECMKREADPETGLCTYCKFEESEELGNEFEEEFEAESDWNDDDD